MQVATDASVACDCRCGSALRRGCSKLSGSDRCAAQL